MIRPAETPMTAISAAQVHQLVATHLALVTRLRRLAAAADAGVPRSTLAAELAAAARDAA